MGRHHAPYEYSSTAVLLITRMEHLFKTPHKREARKQNRWTSRRGLCARVLCYIRIRVTHGGKYIMRIVGVGCCRTLTGACYPLRLVVRYKRRLRPRGRCKRLPPHKHQAAGRWKQELFQLDSKTALTEICGRTENSKSSIPTQFLFESWTTNRLSHHYPPA